MPVRGRALFSLPLGGWSTHAPAHDTEIKRLHLNQLVKNAEKLAAIDLEFERVK